MRGASSTITEPTGFRSSVVWPYLVLLRPANLVTALADILTGYAAAGLPNNGSLPWLLLSTLGLYGGGVVLNDVFDAELDARERPERPIPSGQVSRRNAGIFGFALLALGILLAFMASPLSGGLAVAAAGCAVLYDAWGKRRSIFGPVNMGMCRGFNLLLGVSAAPALVSQRWYIALLPLLYIAAITAVSRGEVHGGSRRTGLLALALLNLVVVALLALTWTQGFRVLPMVPFLLLLSWRVFPPFWRAYRTPDPQAIRGAVMAGVLSLIVLDAALAAGYAGFLYGLGVALLLYVARWLSRLFAVT